MTVTSSPRNFPTSIWLMSRSSHRSTSPMWPASIKRKITAIRLLLPQPLRPTTAVLLPRGIFRSKPFNTSGRDGRYRIWSPFQARVFSKFSLICLSVTITLIAVWLTSSPFSAAAMSRRRRGFFRSDPDPDPESHFPFVIAYADPFVIPSI